MKIEDLFAEFAGLKEVEAIALGGSRASENQGNYDEKSDYDVYVYVTRDIEEAQRREILLKYCQTIEIGNHYWETEDNCTLENGVDLDIIYRQLDNFAGEAADVVFSHHSRNGYTTCMWHNLITCKVLYDRNSRLEELKQKFSVPYPAQLKRNIIENNRKLLGGVLPSFDAQIAKAYGRRDLVSINHRTAEFLASYFDILFALNELTHPGEKRLMQLCVEKCRLLPKDFEANLEKLFASMFRQDIGPVIARMIDELDRILE